MTGASSGWPALRNRWAFVWDAAVIERVGAWPASPQDVLEPTPRAALWPSDRPLELFINKLCDQMGCQLTTPRKLQGRG
jgi:hypothetical protein